MIGEGFKLIILGMGVVYIFLGILILAMHLNARLLRGFTERENQAPVQTRTGKKKRSLNLQMKSKSADRQRLMAVMTAAIAAHRARKDE